MVYAARINGTGSAFPENRVTNDDLAKKISKYGVETNDQWIRARTGIIERRMSMAENAAEYNSSLGAVAARRALSMAQKQPEDIDQIIYATCTPDTLLPSTACWLQQKIGAKNAWAVDINAACSGFVYGIIMAEQFIRTGQVKTSLKDSRLMLELGQRLGSPMLMTNVWSQVAQMAYEKGYAEKDSVAFYEVLRGLAGLEERHGIDDEPFGKA